MTRSLRDWSVDIALFLLALLFGLVVVAMRVETGSAPRQEWLFALDQLVGVAGCGLLWLRRRWPVGVAAVLMAVGCVSELVGGAAMVALFTVAVHRSLRVTGVLFAAGLVSSTLLLLLRPAPGESLAFSVGFGFAVQCAVVGWGLVVRHRRELVVSLRERAVRAEAEAQLRADRAQLQAREAIAREMHDVLGHRLSLLSVHAGALEYRPDAPAEDVARAAGVIRESAHQALQDLREVIGVLRAPVQEMPQPTFADVPELVAESARAGMPVVLRNEITAEVPDTLGRTVYRIVQESLTNARKHAAGSTVDITVRDSDGLKVEIVNSVGEPGEPGGGQGIAGLRERVALAGGQVDAGPEPGGGWRVSAWLPWPA
jgi:signal transduction histidine kinase